MRFLFLVMLMTGCVGEEDSGDTAVTYSQDSTGRVETGWRPVSLGVRNQNGLDAKGFITKGVEEIDKPLPFAKGKSDPF